MKYANAQQNSISTSFGFGNARLGSRIQVSVTCEDGKIVIAQDAERAAVKAAEAEFMDKEMKALQKRYEAEKVKIRAKMVAEQGARW